MVVPCFNEAARLDPSAFVAAVCHDPSLAFLFVDDGSTDGTADILHQLVEDHPQVGEALVLEKNQGKAEAVRRGILRAAAGGPEFVGYWDADLATPLGEIERFVRVMDDRPAVEIVLGSRVNLLGHRVVRRLPRHYISRVFATMVATGLSLPVYDTQCGAKLIRCSPHTIALFEERFFSRWIFDAELLARAIDWSPHPDGQAHVRASTYELPLNAWSDVDGSRIRPGHFVGATRDLARIFARHTVHSRSRRGEGGLTIRVATAVRRVLTSMRVEAPRINPVGRLWRTAVTIPVYGVFVLWTRLRNWVSGPVSYPVTGVDGTHYVCRVPDLVQSYLFMFGVWEPDLTAFIRRRMARGGHFVDVGANIGYHSFVAARAAAPGCRAVAIEASPRISRQLRSHVELNEFANVDVINKAASDHHGQLRIFAGPEHNTGLTTSLATRGFDEDDGVVECAPLGDLVHHETTARVRLVKIDVEGAEGDVLRGMTSFLDGCPDDVEILVELSPRWWDDEEMTPAIMLQPLFDRGFNAYEIDNNLWPWRYLWPNRVRAPKRSRRDLSRRPQRIDLVLSRVDADRL